MRRLTYFVACSLDGFIASTEGGFEAFPMEGDHIAALFKEWPETLPGAALQAMGVKSSNQTFDTVVMGWNTFAVGAKAGVLDPYPHLKQFVCSQHHGPKDAAPDVTVTSEPPVQLVRKLKAEASTRDIWLCGGGRLAAALVGEIDRLVLKVNPVTLGRGIRLFETERYEPQPWRLEHSRPFESGVVMQTYGRK